MYRPAIIAGCVFAALAVVLGAFGAHALKELTTADQLQVYETGVRYQFYHAFALLAAGILYQFFSAIRAKAVTWLFNIGILLFSGSLYLLTGLKISGGSLGPAGALTPIGGVCFIVAWILLLAGIIKSSK
jgi:uncharacterized membrane protein YgdD (TMEM256/DUF423 family)